MRTVELSILAVGVMLDNLEAMYNHAVRLNSEGCATPAAQMLITAYEEAENVLKAIQTGRAE